MSISLVMSGTLWRWQCSLCFEIGFFFQKIEVVIQIVAISLIFCPLFGAGKQNKSFTSPENRKQHVYNVPTQFFKYMSDRSYAGSNAHT